MFDLANNVKVVHALNSAQKTADTNGIAIDMTGYEAIVFIVQTAAVSTADADNYFSWKVEESDAVGFGSGVTTVTDDATRVNYGPVRLNATSQANTSFKAVGVAKGIRQYMRIVADETGTADAVFGVIAVLGNPRHRPVA